DLTVQRAVKQGSDALFGWCATTPVVVVRSSPDPRSHQGLATEAGGRGPSDPDRPIGICSDSDFPCPTEPPALRDQIPIRRGSLTDQPLCHRGIHAPANGVFSHTYSRSERPQLERML